VARHSSTQDALAPIFSAKPMLVQGWPFSPVARCPLVLAFFAGGALPFGQGGVDQFREGDTLLQEARFGRRPAHEFLRGLFLR